MTEITDAELRERLAAHLVIPEGPDWNEVLWRMSRQLEDKIRELEGERGELEETIRRVGKALAVGLDRRGALELTVQTALDASAIVRRDRPFTRREEELLEYLAGQAVISIENADLHATVQRQAITDELAGLSNRRQLDRALDRELDRHRRVGTPIGLVLLDIDDFKKVNDSYGHAQGDAVLIAVAGVLRELARDIAELARWGRGVRRRAFADRPEGAALLAERMREAIEQLRVPCISGGGEIQVTASFGVASVPESASDGKELLDAAYRRCLRVTRDGRWPRVTRSPRDHRRLHSSCCSG